MSGAGGGNGGAAGQFAGLRGAHGANKQALANAAAAVEQMGGVGGLGGLGMGAQAQFAQMGAFDPALLAGLHGLQGVPGLAGLQGLQGLGGPLGGGNQMAGVPAGALHAPAGPASLNPLVLQQHQQHRQMQAAQQQHQAAQHAALRQQQAAAMGSVPGMQSPNQQMLSALMGAGAGPGSLNQTLLQQMAGAGHVLDPQSPGSSAFKDTVRRELQASNQQQQFAAAARNSLQGGFAGPGAPGAPGGQGGLIGSSANAAASSRAELIISAINVDSSGQQQHAQGQNPGGSNGRRPSVPPGPPPGMGDFMSPGPGPVPSPFPKPAQMPSGTATILTQSQMQALADQTRANFNGGAPPSPFPPGSESFDPTSPAGNPSVAQQHMQQIRAAQQRERQEQQNLAIRQQLLSASSRFAGPGEPQQPGDGLMSPPAMRPDELRAPSGGSVGPAGYGSFGRMGPPPPQQRGISPAAGTPQMQPGQAGGEAQGNRYRAMLDILIHDYLRKSGYTAASAALVNESESIRSTMVGRPGQPGQPGGVPRLPDQMDLPDSILLEWFSAGWERWFAPPPGGFPAPSPQQSPGTLANARAAALTQAGGLRPGAAAPSPVVPFGTPNPAPAGARADPGSAAGVLGMPRASLKGVMDHLGLKDKDPDQLSQQDIEAIMHRSAMEGEEGGPPFKRQRTEEFEGFGGNGQQMRGGVGQMSPMAGFQQMLAQNDLQSPPGSVPQTAQDILGALGGISGTPPAARESAQIARHAQAAQRRAAGLSGLPGAGYQPQGLPPGFPGTSTGSMGSPLGVGARPPTPGSGQLESPDVARAVPGQQMPGATVQAQLRQQQLIMIQQQQAGGFQQPGGSRSFTGESPASAKSPAESNAPSSGTRGGKRRAAAEGSPPSESPQAGKKGRKPPANREAPPSPKRKAPARTRNRRNSVKTEDESENEGDADADGEGDQQGEDSGFGSQQQQQQQPPPQQPPMTMRPQDIQQSLLYGQFQPNVGQQFQNAGQQFQNAMQMMRNPAGMADPMTMAFGGPRPPSDDLGMSGFANANGGRLPENANFDELSSWLTNNGETENLNAGWNRSNGGNQVDYGMGALSAELFHQSGRLGPGEENMIVDVGSVSDLSSGLIKGGRISPELGGPGEPEAGSDGPARLVASLKAHSQKVSACAFDFAGRVLASGGHDRKVAVWDVRPDADMAAPIWTLDGHTNQVNCARFSNVCMVLRNGAPMPSSSSRAAISGMPVLLATGSMDKTVRIHIVQGLLPDRVSLEAELGAPFLRSFSEHKASVTSVDFCPIAIAGADGLEVELPLDGTTARIDVLCASVDGDGEVKLWSAVTGRVEKSILLPLRAAYATNCVRFRPASHWVPPGTGSRAGKGGPKGILATVACAVANQLNLIELALPSSQTDSPLSNAASPKTVNHRNVGAASVSGHTGVTFSSGDDEYSIRIYSTPHAKNINSVDWSNDGSYLVTASEDVVCVWEVGTAGMPDSGCTVAFQIPLSTGKIASCVILQDAARAGLPSTAADEPATPSSPTRARSRPPRIAFGDYDRFYIWNPPSAGSSAASQAVVPSVQSGNIGCLASVGAWDGTVKADPVTVDENPHLLHQEPRDILLAAGSSAREDNLKLWSVQQRDA